MKSDNNLSCTTLLSSTSSTLPSELTKECRWTVKLWRRGGTKKRDYPETENVGKFLDCVMLCDCVIVIRQTSRVSRLSLTRFDIIWRTWSMPNRLSVSILQPSTTTNWMSSAYRRSNDVVKINKLRIFSDNCASRVWNIYRSGVNDKLWEYRRSAIVNYKTLIQLFPLSPNKVPRCAETVEFGAHCINRLILRPMKIREQSNCHEKCLFSFSFRWGFYGLKRNKFALMLSIAHKRHLHKSRFMSGSVFWGWEVWG